MKRILIVDDVPGWVRFHKTNIQYLDSNIEIDEAYNAKEALNKIESSIDNPYHTIFTDLQMESDFLPKLAGQWLIEQIKTYDKYYKNTKIVIISAAQNIERFAQKYDVSYIPKTTVRNSDAEIYRQYIM